MKAPIPPDEAARLATLQEYDILDTEAEKDFEDLVELASHICETPIALMSLVDSDRQWFKSKVGLEADQTGRDEAFCAHAILAEEVLVVPDARHDERFAENPLVVGGPSIRFYAGAPLIAPNGHAVGTLCVIDAKPRELTTTQRRMLEILARQVVSQLELRRKIDDLETMADELRRVTDAAVCANRAKTDFLAGMSHELRTPLNAIIGFADGLLRRGGEHPLTDYQKSRVTRISVAGQHLLSLINDLLDIAKVEAGEMRVTTSTFDPAVLMSEVGDLVEALVAEKNGAVRFVIDAVDLPDVTSDRDKIRQMLINLIGNAVKFTDEGEVTLRARHDGRAITFEIVDTGIGIAASELDRIFEKFHQVDGVQRDGSTGLGLSLCRSLTALLDGRLTVTSEPGRGSTFTLTIPVEHDAVRRAA